MKFAYLLAALLLLTPQVMADGLPDLGESSQDAFSPQQERQIGQAVMRDIRASGSLVDDAELTEYLNDLGYRLVANSQGNRQDYEFFLIQDNTLNAFALPGGYIGVHTGLIQSAQSESELASVLAHEIAHVSQHHLARIIAKTQQSTWASLAALAVAILAARSNPQIATAAITTAQAATVQTQLDYTRDHEREADRIGLQTLSRAGFDVHAMPAFFGRLQKFGRLYENNAPEYLRTHPLTTERIADVQNRVETLPYHQVPDSLEFQLVRAKLNAGQGTPDQAVKTFEATLREKKYTSETAQRYGLISALLRARDFARAEREIAALRKAAPANPMVENLAAQVKAAAGQTAAALAQYRAALKRFPHYRALVYNYAQTMLQNRQEREALNLVGEQLKTYPDDWRLYQLQAQAYAAQGKILPQHLALAEAYARQGNLTAAIEHLQIGLAAKDGDFYQMSIAEARLRQLRQQDIEQRKQAKP